MRLPTNDHRVTRGDELVGHYARRWIPEGPHPSNWYEDAVDAVTDILHAYASEGNDPQQLVDEALTAFKAEA